MRIERNVEMRTRDGTVLRSDIYRPARGAGLTPAILVRTPYDKLALEHDPYVAFDRLPQRLRATSNAFLPGHRIRLDITSSCFPSYDRNHNTAAHQNADSTLVPARQEIHRGGVAPTRLVLPWLPNGSR
jgi:predicted acyl esterase